MKVQKVDLLCLQFWWLISFLFHLCKHKGIVLTPMLFSLQIFKFSILEVKLIHVDSWVWVKNLCTEIFNFPFGINPKRDIVSHVLFSCVGCCMVWNLILCWVKRSKCIIPVNYWNSIPLNTNNISFLCFISFLLQPSIHHWYYALKRWHDTKRVSL